MSKYTRGITTDDVPGDVSSAFVKNGLSGTVGRMSLGHVIWSGENFRHFDYWGMVSSRTLFTVSTLAGWLWKQWWLRRHWVRRPRPLAHAGRQQERENRRLRESLSMAKKRPTRARRRVHVRFRWRTTSRQGQPASL